MPLDIKALRVTKRLTQDQLADLIKVSRGTIINWEKGKTSPDEHELLALSKVFNIKDERGSDKSIPLYDIVAVGGREGIANLDPTAGNINKWEDRHLENSTKMIKQFLAHWRINSIWWRTGEGDIFEPDPTSDRKPEVITNKSEPSELQQALLEWKGLFFQAKHDLKIAQEKIVELENRLKDKGGHSARDSK